ncbi:hypothetical protein [Nocardioides sp.]|uniref:hypothetical protein n=1 Tax=Nocardioides sp. TaxID=35761 RepID=UPI003D10CF59
MSVSADSPTIARDRLARLGRWCTAAALVGLLQGLALLVWPHQVPEDRFSFPLTGVGFVIAQATFFLQHLPLALAVLALAGAVTATPARYGLIAASVGLGLLAVVELAAMSGATTEEDSALASAIYSAYGPPVLLAGAGLTVAGITVVRRHELDARVGWLLVALGGWVFVGLTPALSSGSFVGGRVAIIVWMLLFAGLGQAMSNLARARG